MKGQSFLIIAIIFITILALIKANISFQKFEKESFGFEFENVKEEIVRSVEFSIYEKENITKNLENFVDFARNSLKRKTLNLKAIILEGFIENNELNISLKNLLGNEIIFLNLSFSYNDSFREFKDIKDEEKINATFIFPSQDANYTLKISYTTPFSEESEELPVGVEVGKKKFILFVDMTIKSEEIKIRDKIFRNYLLFV
jgi:hypothetical protein